MEPVGIFHNIRDSKESLLIWSKGGETVNPHLINKIKLEYKPNFWHKFVVSNVATYDRNFVLKTILDYVHPYNLVPASYAKKKNGYFIARHCIEAILKLAHKGLSIPNPLEKNKPFRIIIVVNFCSSDAVKIDKRDNILQVLKKRFNKADGFLNLIEFCNDKDLHEYCPLFQPMLMLYVTHIAAELSPTYINLSSNHIKTLTALHPLASCNITIIDLRDNELSSVDNLLPLRKFKELSHLKLDGNPLCDNYDNYNYVIDIKNICPNLKELDNVNVTTPRTNRNYFCSLDALDLTNQFIEHFFTVFDYENRLEIADLYHEHAFFSITSSEILFQHHFQLDKLDYFDYVYSLHNSFAGQDQFYIYGRSKIMALFAKFPQTQHNPNTFLCDVIYFTEKLTVMGITGTFKQKDQFFNFRRNFALCCNQGEYHIVNDQFLICKASEEQICQFQKSLERSESYYLPVSWKQRRTVENTFQSITNLKSNYSQKFLNHCKYNLKETLNYFRKLYINDDLPSEAFIQTTQMDSPVPCGSARSNMDISEYSNISSDLDDTSNSDNSKPLTTDKNSSEYHKADIAVPQYTNGANLIPKVSYQNSNILIIGKPPRIRKRRHRSRKLQKLKLLQQNLSVGLENCSQLQNTSSKTHQANAFQIKPCNNLNGPEILEYQKDVPKQKSNTTPTKKNISTKMPELLNQKPTNVISTKKNVRSRKNRRQRQRELKRILMQTTGSSQESLQEKKSVPVNKVTKKKKESQEDAIKKVPKKKKESQQDSIKKIPKKKKENQEDTPQKQIKKSPLKKKKIKGVKKIVSTKSMFK